MLCRDVLCFLQMEWDFHNIVFNAVGDAETGCGQANATQICRPS